MMKIIVLSLCLLIAVANAVKIVRCDLGNGQVINAGDSQPQKGSCTLLTCHEDGSVSGKTCAPFQEGNCKRIKGDPNKLYPKCCDYPKC